jgi:hypothetical protein
VTDRLVVGRVVSLEGGRPVVAVNAKGPYQPNGDRIAAMVVAARNWKGAKAKFGALSHQAQDALNIMLAAADGID